MSDDGTKARGARRPSSPRTRPLDVAIIGMACRFPGARDIFEFWKNVLAARDCTRDVPPDRWDPAVFFDPDSTANDRVYCRRGGYLDDPVEFDATRHGVMPLAVAGGEPEQFLVLDATRAALEDAGLAGGASASGRVEVVVGKGNYFNRGNLTRLQHGRIVAQTLGILRALHPEWTEADCAAVRADLKASLPPFEPATIPGQLTNATAGRIANRLDLSGASYVIDAASASSLVAVDLAARALVDRRADLAIAGGVYLQPDVDFPLVFCGLGALSRRGEARPFTRSADGTLPGEGVGVLVLKRLAEAERAGDRIYAVLKGVGLASDGRASGLAAPSARGHARAMRRAYRLAGIDPATVDLVEGHALGVPASDRAELRALRAVFPRPERGRRTLGAASGLIGHAMPAAGMAGLIKTALALYHRVLPPINHADEPHALLADSESPFALSSTPRPWIHGHADRPRRAGVNTFGFAGINAHAVLEEHAASADGTTAGCMLDWDSEAILLGAPDRAGLIERTRSLIDWLDSGQNHRVPLKDLAYTLNRGTDAFPVRVGLVVSSVADLRGRLESIVGRISDPACRSVRDARGTYFWDEPFAGQGRVAFMYPGEGSQYAGMLADLCPHFPELRSVFDTADRIAREKGREWLPSEQLLTSTDGGDSPGLWAIDTAVSVVLATQHAIHELLFRLGLRPDAVVGHSSGEIIALAAAGVLVADKELEERLGDLGSIFERLEKSGLIPSAALLAVAAPRDRVEAVCREVAPEVRIAIDNCPHQVVTSGPARATEAVAARLRAEGVVCEALPHTRAYHSPDFSPALDPLETFFQQLPMSPPKLPVYSCMLSARMSNDVASIRRFAVEQWERPVEFRETIKAMHDDGIRVFVDVGGRGNLAGFVEDTLRGQPHFAVAANLARRSGITQLNHVVASLYAQGMPIRADHLYARRRPCAIDVAADVPVPRPAPALAIGFPEMRLSDDLVERLRSREPTEPSMGGPTEPIAPEPKCENGRQSFPAFTSGNGHRNGDLFAEAQTRFRREDRLSPHAQPGGSASSRNSNRVVERLSEQGAPEPGDAHARAMLSHFETMDAFLETQRAVMEAYLATRRGPTPAPDVAKAPSSEVAIHADRPVGRIEAATVQGVVEKHAPENIGAAVACERAAAHDVRALLLEQVSRRTGYPREMLALEFDMEGDLGIDSIKRIEIFGELQAQGVVRAPADVDRLSRCRTLGQVLDLLEQRGPAVGQDGAVPIEWVGDIESFVPGRELIAIRWLDARNDPVAEHHTLGGRRLSAIDTARLGLPVIPFTIMAEMLAQAAAPLVPGRVVVGLRDVQANRWIPYEESPVALEVRAVRDAERPDEAFVSIRNQGTRANRKPGGDDAAVVGVVVFGESRTPGPVASAFVLDEAGLCRFTAEELYRDQWLFHGPALRALTRVGASSRHGIEGTLRILPRRHLLPVRLWPTLHTDPIVLDAFTHLLGCWGIDKKAGEEGDVMFPLRLTSLSIHAPDPPEGTAIECRIAVREISRYRVNVDAELITPEGRVWMAISGWEDWRFHWPGCYRDVMRQPHHFLVGEPLALPGGSADVEAGAVAVWLEPPADMSRPVWADVLEWVQLGAAERAANRARGESLPALTLRVWGRIAAKEAVRRLWLNDGGEPLYPADLLIEADPNGRPIVRSLLYPDREDIPAITFAHTDGVAVALAARDPRARVGIDIERVRPRGVEFEMQATLAIERDWLDRNTEPGAERDEWLARFWCAREAVGKATGLGLIHGPASLAIIIADRSTGAVAVQLREALASACPELAGEPVRCVTARRGEYAWAWTIGERASS
jgi:acyl transferase domain-containing protein/phosphopantetheinyl transferase (holo-ACP synthase)